VALSTPLGERASRRPRPRPALVVLALLAAGTLPFGRIGK